MSVNNDYPEDAFWLLDKIENNRTFNAVVDAISDLKIENRDDACEQEIIEVLERYNDPGVNMLVAVISIQIFYSRLYELGAKISQVKLTQRSNAPYVVISELHQVK
jgi:hypothetical protein